MGNLMQDGAGEVHGVLYRLRCVDFATLAHMEHEYRCVCGTKSHPLYRVCAASRLHQEA